MGKRAKLIPLSFSGAHSLKHGRQEIGERIVSVENKSLERQVKRDKRVSTHSDTHM